MKDRESKKMSLTYGGWKGGNDTLLQITRWFLTCLTRKQFHVTEQFLKLVVFTRLVKLNLSCFQ